MAIVKEVKNFDQISKTLTEEAGEGPEFILGDITFKCVPIISTAIYAKYMGDDAEGSQLFYFKFLKEVIDSAQLPDLERILFDKESPAVPLGTLEQIIIWLGEEYAARPTKP